jgi:hypothetical protein
MTYVESEVTLRSHDHRSPSFSDFSLRCHWLPATDPAPADAPSRHPVPIWAVQRDDLRGISAIGVPRTESVGQRRTIRPPCYLHLISDIKPHSPRSTAPNPSIDSPRSNHLDKIFIAKDDAWQVCIALVTGPPCCDSSHRPANRVLPLTTKLPQLLVFTSTRFESDESRRRV